MAVAAAPCSGADSPCLFICLSLLGPLTAAVPAPPPLPGLLLPEPVYQPVPGAQPGLVAVPDVAWQVASAQEWLVVDGLELRFGAGAVCRQ